MGKSGAGEMMCWENEAEGQQLMMVVLKKGILMMLQQRRVALELLHHYGLAFAMPSYGRS